MLRTAQATAVPTAGWYQPRENEPCELCPAGTWSRVGQFGSCSACPASELANDNGDGCKPCTPVCEVCGPGYVSASDFQSCIPCPAGTFRAAGMSACESVPENGVAGLGSASFALCEDGYVSNQARDTCLPCSKGFYKFNSTCQRCPENSVAPFDGTYRSENMSRCEPVPHRTVSIPDRSWFQPCEPGWVANNIATLCLPCPKGSFEEDGACRTCATNAIAPAESMTSCETIEKQMGCYHWQK
eukprot:tig00000383_g24621.t1